MPHNHNHFCNHPSVKYCSHCNTVYCLDCNQEWNSKMTWTYSPYTWQYGQLGQHTTAGGGNISGNLNTLNDGHITNCVHGN